MESSVITAVSAFGPKVVEAQYYVPAGQAAVLFGVVTALMAMLGNMLGESVYDVASYLISEVNTAYSREFKQGRRVDSFENVI